MDKQSSGRGWAVPVPPSALMPEAPASQAPAPMAAPPPMALQDCETPVMVFICKQPWRQPYEMDTGMSRGTIFPALDLPFLGEGACRR